MKPRPIPLLAWAALGSGTLAILAAPWALALPWLHVACKPLTTLLIIAHAWPRGRATPLLRRGVLAGLWLSLAGDVALLWSRQGFLPGLVSFLLAHLAYLWAFTREGPRFAAWPLPFVHYGLVAIIVLGTLWPGVPPALRVPVVAYVVCLASMAAQAAVVGWQARASARRRAGMALALGGALFFCSDALLAINRFAVPLPAASLWILATYWLAQWCIASWLDGAGARLTRGD